MTAAVVFAAALVAGQADAVDVTSCGQVVIDCADVASEQQPVVTGVSLCGTSRRTTSSGDWDVCTSD